MADSVDTSQEVSLHVQQWVDVCDPRLSKLFIKRVADKC